MIDKAYHVLRLMLFTFFFREKFDGKSQSILQRQNQEFR